MQHDEAKHDPASIKLQRLLEQIELERKKFIEPSPDSNVGNTLDWYLKVLQKKVEIALRENNTAEIEKVLENSHAIISNINWFQEVSLSSLRKKDWRSAAKVCYERSCKAISGEQGLFTNIDFTDTTEIAAMADLVKDLKTVIETPKASDEARANVERAYHEETSSYWREVMRPAMKWVGAVFLLTFLTACIPLALAAASAALPVSLTAAAAAVAGSTVASASAHAAINTIVITCVVGYVKENYGERYSQQYKDSHESPHANLTKMSSKVLKTHDKENKNLRFSLLGGNREGDKGKSPSSASSSPKKGKLAG